MRIGQLRGCIFRLANGLRVGVGPDLRIVLIALVCLASFAGLNGSASAWVFYKDDRRPSHVTMIGTLEADLPGGTSQGTAVLVGDCGILTNFHVAFGPWPVTALRAPSREFTGTFTLTEVWLPDGSNPTARATPVLWGDYRGPGRHLRNPQEDWAYLVLSPCLGKDFGHFNLRPLESDDVVRDGSGYLRSFNAFGYSTGQQMVDPACSILATGSETGGDTWLHDCVVQSGDSGGPIVDSGTLNLVALSSGMRYDIGTSNCESQRPSHGAALQRWDERCANVAVRLSWNIKEAILAAEVAANLQMTLAKLGYDTEPHGTINGPLTRASIGRFQRQVGMSVTGEPSCLLRMVLSMKAAAISSHQ